MNPIWFSYGTAPNSAFLMGQDGHIYTAQIWLEVAEIRIAIDDLLD